MWLLVVFYVGIKTPPTLEVFHMKTRDACREMKAITEETLKKDPTIGMKHKVECRKIDVA